MREREIPDKEPPIPALSPEAQRLFETSIPGLGALELTDNAGKPINTVLFGEPTEDDIAEMEALEAELDLDLTSLLTDMKSNPQKHVS